MTELRRTGDPVYDKTRRNMWSGYNKLKSGDFAPFNGFAPEHHKGIALRIELNKASNAQILERVISPAAKIASSLGIEVFSAGSESMPIHATILDLVTTAQDAISRRQQFDHLAQVVNVAELAEMLYGTEFSFDRLVPGVSSYISAQTIPENITLVRKLMLERGLAFGVSPKYDDQHQILHATTTRLAAKPLSTDVVQKLVNELMRINHQLKEDPINVAIDTVGFLPNQVYPDGNFINGIPLS